MNGLNRCELDKKLARLDVIPVLRKPATASILPASIPARFSPPPRACRLRGLGQLFIRRLPPRREGFLTGRASHRPSAPAARLRFRDAHTLSSGYSLGRGSPG